MLNINWSLTYVQLRSDETTGASSYSYVFAILSMFPLEFWNKWYTIGKPLYRALWIRKKNWAWHHPRDGHAHLTEKASLLLKPVWSLPWQKSLPCPVFFLIQRLYIRAFQWYIIFFRILVGTCSKWQKHMNKNLGVSYSFSETVYVGRAYTVFENEYGPLVNSY